MTAISIRGLEPQIAEKLKVAAQKESKSVNQFGIETIKEKRNGLKLYTKDHHFSKIPGINLL